MTSQNNILESIGNTPLVKLNRIPEANSATILAKCEYLNPAGSIKDRMANYIISKAEADGLIKPGGTIVEGTSGNTGMGLALVAAVKDYKIIITIPDKMSQEKIDMLKSFGGQVIITPTDVPGDSPEHYIQVAKRIAGETPNSYFVNQYHNPTNIEAHYNLTAKELWEQTTGSFDAFVAGPGTGGTLSGVGKFVKERTQNIKIVGVDPIGSVHYSLFNNGEIIEPDVYYVEGIGDDVQCEALDFSVIDEMYQVNDQECFSMARRLVREEGLFCGGSSGGIVYIATKLAKDYGPGKTIVAILPDSGSRYITKYLSDDWMKDKGFEI